MYKYGTTRKDVNTCSIWSDSIKLLAKQNCMIFYFLVFLSNQMIVYIWYDSFWNRLTLKLKILSNIVSMWANGGNEIDYTLKCNSDAGINLDALNGANFKELKSKTLIATNGEEEFADLHLNCSKPTNRYG